MCCNTLVDTGNTVAVIEHNLDVIKSADWVIDLGPEGGDGGGRIVAEGTPEDIAKVAESYTGQFLAGPAEAAAGKARACGEGGGVIIVCDERKQEIRSRSVPRSS